MVDRIDECSTADEPVPSAEEVAAVAGEVRTGGRRRLILAGLVLIVATCALYFLPIRQWLADAPQLRTLLGVWVYPTTVLAVALLVSLGVPRLAFCAAGGLVFGFWWGLALVHAGTLLGYYTAFLFIRWSGREWVLHRWPKVRKWADVLHEQGIAGVVLVRQLPIHGSLVNICLGLSHVKHRQFLIGSAIGLLPEAIPATLVGAGLVRASAGGSAGYLAVAAVAVVVLWIACGYLLRVMRNSRTAAAMLVQASSLKGVGD